jgi:hypothetical protein
MHCPPSQQPFGQLVASQTHRPPTPRRPGPHARQASPFAPHAPSAVPARHAAPSQQPEGQLWAVQVQRPPTQAWSGAQAAQAPPLVPQAAPLSPPRQVAPSQQPSQLRPSQVQAPFRQR